MPRRLAACIPRLWQCRPLVLLLRVARSRTCAGSRKALIDAADFEGRMPVPGKVEACVRIAQGGMTGVTTQACLDSVGCACAACVLRPLYKRKRQQAISVWKRALHLCQHSQASARSWQQRLPHRLTQQRPASQPTRTRPARAHWRSPPRSRLATCRLVNTWAADGAEGSECAHPRTFNVTVASMSRWAGHSAGPARADHCRTSEMKQAHVTLRPRTTHQACNQRASPGEGAAGGVEAQAAAVLGDAAAAGGGAAAGAPAPSRAAPSPAAGGACYISHAAKLP